jgi:hypothetical protein
MRSSKKRTKFSPFIILLVAVTGLGIIMMGVAQGATIYLQDIDSGLTSPQGNYRWLDAADQQYSSTYQNNYNYTQANVIVTYNEIGDTLKGTLISTNLKPNFAYQLKLTGTPGMVDNERIGLSGRWWQEEWDGSKWANGQNLNNKGDGSSPNPNDGTYFTRRDIIDSASPTGLKYRYTGYLVFDYFTTDETGAATLSFETDSCYHVLWKTTQTQYPYQPSDDGPIKSKTFNPDTLSPAYDVDYEVQTVDIFGEWERLPVGGVFLQSGDYENVQIILTEESFHGSGLAGGWAAAMGADILFTIEPDEPPTTRLEGDVKEDGAITGADGQKVAQHIVGTAPLTGEDAQAADVNDSNPTDQGVIPDITGADLQLIMQHVVGTITVFPDGVNGQYIP